MADETEILKKTEAPTTTTDTVRSKTETVAYSVGAVSPDSRILGVSVMAWALMILVVSVCALNFCQIGIYDHTVTLSLMVASFYAGAKSSK